jgi:hypothetical protein
MAFNSISVTDSRVTGPTWGRTKTAGRIFYYGIGGASSQTKRERRSPRENRHVTDRLRESARLEICDLAGRRVYRGEGVGAVRIVSHEKSTGGYLVRYLGDSPVVKKWIRQ